MRSRWLLNLLLATVVVALGLLAYFRPHGDASVGPRLTALTPETVTRIRIERVRHEPMQLEKAADGWRMLAPLRARANQFNIDSLLRVTTTTSSFQAPVDAAGLAQYGLDKPGVRLQLNDEEILIGAQHPLRQQHYVRYHEHVHLIPSYPLGSVFLDYNAFLDSQLLEDGRKLSALRLPAFRLVLKDGLWRRDPPPPKNAPAVSQDRLNEIVAEWENARAFAVQRRSAKTPIAQIDLAFDQNGKHGSLTLDILAYRPELIIARRDEGLEYHFPEEIGKRLLELRLMEERVKN